MPEIGGVRGGVPPQDQTQAANRADRPLDGVNAPHDATDAPVGLRGALGQPTGMPAPVLPGQVNVLPDVLAGRDASQLTAAEQMRATGGTSATDALLGLDRQPSLMGALLAPPGNSEALRHMTPTMRRTIMRTLLDKQRAQMRNLARLMRQQGRDDEDAAGGDEEESGGFVNELDDNNSSKVDEAQRARARHELTNAARMLDLLNELLVMQDYTISQMGTFSQG